MTDALVSCAVGHVEYALRAGDIVAVMRAERMRTPAACEGGIGVVTVGGDRASVYPLGATIGLPAGPDAMIGRDRHVVVLRGAQGLVGWLVDRVARSRLPARTHLLPLPALVGPRARQWFAGVLHASERTMLLLASAPTVSEGALPVSVAPGVPTAATMARGNGAEGPLVVTFTTAALPDCGASRYAVSARRVCGVESNLDVVPVPGCERPVIGVGVWHGHVVPVIDLQSAAALSEGTGQRLLIIRGGGRLTGTPVAIPIDAETALCQPTDDNPPVNPADPGGRPLPRFVAGLFDVRGHTVALIDPDQLLNEDREPNAAGATLDDLSCSAPGQLSSPWTLAERRTLA